jgi:hypothetical protein
MAAAIASFGTTSPHVSYHGFKMGHRYLLVPLLDRSLALRHTAFADFRGSAAPSHKTTTSRTPSGTADDGSSYTYVIVVLAIKT